MENWQGMKISDSKRKKHVLQDISKVILKNDLLLFDKSLEEQLAKQSAYLSPNEYEMYKRGKKLRPILLLLFARMVRGNETELPARCYKAASSLEMLHVASLMHDDIIDDSNYRRNVQSVHRNRNIASAIVLGDMQFLQAVRGFVDSINFSNELELVQMILDVAFDVSRGEMDEITAPQTEDYDQMRYRYLKTIERKTATLMGLACEAGVILAGGKRTDARRAGFVGRSFGMAFQIIDDVKDCIYKTADSGKDSHIDLKNRTLSLPIIYALKNSESNSCLKTYMADNNKELSQEIIRFVSNYGLVKAYECARTYAYDALEYMDFFPHNHYSKCLNSLITEMVNNI